MTTSARVGERVALFGWRSGGRAWRRDRAFFDPKVHSGPVRVVLKEGRG